MIKSATAVKARIKNKSGGDSDKSQILLRIYMMERFLERVAMSKYRSNFVLKGGLLVTSLVGVDMRSTMDVDTTVKAIQLDEKNARKIMEEIMAIDLEDGVTFNITSVDQIMEGHEYEGLRFMVECSLDKLRQAIKIDISTGDKITPRAISYKLPLIIEDRTIDLWAYNLETLLAEKLETIMARGDVNTRMRDFYDIHILLQSEDDSIDKETLAAAFSATCRHRNSEKYICRFEETLHLIRNSEKMRQQWDNYSKGSYYVGGISWDDVCNSVMNLYELIGCAYVHNSK